MKNYNFRKNDPFSEIDIEASASKIKSIPEEERKESSNKSDLVQFILDEDKATKRLSKKLWWKNNWINFLAMVFAFIAAIPVIIQGIEKILKYIM